MDQGREPFVGLSPVTFQLGSEPLINARIVQILVEKNDPDEIKKLMDAELVYNREKLAILREHAEHHPDAIEARKDRGFRRLQYKYLLTLLPLLLLSCPLVPLAAASVFITISVMIAAAVILNGREREMDIGSLVKIIETVLRKKS